MIRQHYRILLITLGIFLLTIPALSACARAAPTTPSTELTPAVTEEKTAPPEEKVVTEEKPTSQQPPDVQPTPTPVKINISGFAFVAATVTIPVGTIVTWSNKDSVAHTVSSRDNLFDSGNLSSGATFSSTFNQIGTFQYYCQIHPSMTGKIIAGEKGAAPTEEKAASEGDTGDDYAY